MVLRDEFGVEYMIVMFYRKKDVVVDIRER